MYSFILCAFLLFSPGICEKPRDGERRNSATKDVKQKDKDVLCKPRYVDLDDVDQQLLRDAYTPSYDQDDYEEEDVYGPKDSVWLLKAKLKEVKEFMRALTAGLVETKLKIKELMVKHKMSHSKFNDKKKPSHNYKPHHYPHNSDYEQTGYENNLY